MSWFVPSQKRQHHAGWKAHRSTFKLTTMKRRQFLHAAASTGAGWFILPSGLRAGKNAPSNKLNIALMGVWGRGLAHYDSLSEENVVALCDVNEKRLPDAQKRF